jgi:hypothetical protein
MTIAAFIISIFSALFAGFVTLLAFREQRLKLRPYVYISVIDPKTLDVEITNCGLLPAKRVTVSVYQRFKNQVIEQESGSTKHAILLPNQQIYSSIDRQLLEGERPVSIEIMIQYHSNNASYYYKTIYEFNPEGEWIIVEADAN